MSPAAVKVRATAATRGAELRPMLSRFRGKCETCGKPINRGSPIGWSRRRGANHAACVGLDGDAIKAAALSGLGAVVETMRTARVWSPVDGVIETGERLATMTAGDVTRLEDGRVVTVLAPSSDPFGDDVWAGLDLEDLAVAS